MSSLEFLSSNSYFRSLTGVYDSGREKALSAFLLIASVFLSVASGYTTFVGLNQYIPAFFAFLMALGLHTLLFASSWRIGVMLFSDSFKIWLPLIFLVTLTISVFFSYSALLDGIYDKPTRERDEIQRSKIRSEKLVTELTQLVRARSDYENTAKQVRTALDGWYSAVVQTYSGKVNSIRQRLNKDKARYEAYNQRIEQLRQQESTYSTSEAIRRNESAKQGVLANRISPIEPQLGRIESAKQTFDKAYIQLVNSNSGLTIENFSNMTSAYKNYLNEMATDNQTEIKEIPVEAQNSIAEIDDVNKFLTWQESDLNISKKQNLDELKQGLFDFVNRMPKSVRNNTQSDAEVQKVLQQIDSIGKYGGANVHPFILSVGELSNGNYLATGSLMIALALDGLVLLCGLLGARPSSFLTMRRVEELDDAVETGLLAIISLDLKNRQPTGNPFINRIVKILSLCEPDVDSAHKYAIPATISVEKIREEGLSQETGIFLASGLAKYHKEHGKIGLTLRLILWMADQVYRYDHGRQTASSFHDIS
jgi:hypothetical protein